MLAFYVYSCRRGLFSERANLRRDELSLLSGYFQLQGTSHNLRLKEVRLWFHERPLCRLRRWAPLIIS